MTERFSASVAGRIMACPASANLAEAIPNWVDPVVDETKGAKGKGSSIHSLFEKVWELKTSDLDCFAQVVRFVADLRKTRRFNVLIEESVKATWLVTEPGTTADLVLYVQDEIHVIDTKTGKIPVYAEENPQLMFYGASYSQLAPKANGVNLHILQPWSKEGSSSWFCDAARLAQFMEDARAAEQLILAKDTTFGPSDHCTFCPANPHSRGDKGAPLCPAMMNLLYPQPFDEGEILNL